MKFLNSIIYAGELAVGFLAVMLVSACSSNIPANIKQPLEGSPGVAQVRHQTDAYLSQKVRWGGIILNTKNKQNTSELTIIALPLNDDGKPLSSDESPGRFIALIDEFVEPLVYTSEREITVTGRILKAETLKVGEFPYEYPVIQVEGYYLWPEKLKRSYDNYPAYPLYYSPYYPWHYPYYSPHHRHH